MRQIQCPECRGEGVIDVDEGAWWDVRLDDCPSCGGSGQIDDPEDDGTPVLETASYPPTNVRQICAIHGAGCLRLRLDCWQLPPTKAAFVSPYLLRPLRTIEQAERDMTK